MPALLPPALMAWEAEPSRYTVWPATGVAVGLRLPSSRVYSETLPLTETKGRAPKFWPVICG